MGQMSKMLLNIQLGLFTMFTQLKELLKMHLRKELLIILSKEEEQDGRKLKIILGKDLRFILIITRIILQEMQEAWITFLLMKEVNFIFGNKNS